MSPRRDNQLLKLLACAFLLAVVAAFSPLAAARPAEASGARADGAGQEYAYGWPVKPFFEQHPVRGYLGDPRIGEVPATGAISRSLHFGVDVVAPNGTPVYATITGTAINNPRHAGVVYVHGASGVEFEYWHLVPAVRSGQHVVAYRTVVGWIRAPWAHVHFAERRNGVFVNPLRRGAMGPYRDGTRPEIQAVSFERAGVAARAGSAASDLDIVLEVTDMPPMWVPDPRWSGMPLTPRVIRWRMLGPGGRTVMPWRTRFDARLYLPSASFEDVYATRTRQNKAHRPGLYRFYLAREWYGTSLANGRYVVDVVAADDHGNATEHRQAFVISGGSITVGSQEQISH